MNNVVEIKTITSLELVEEINMFRSQEGGRAVLEHSDLLKVIRNEFDEEINEGIISPVNIAFRKAVADSAGIFPCQSADKR